MRIHNLHWISSFVFGVAALGCPADDSDTPTSTNADATAGSESSSGGVPDETGTTNPDPTVADSSEGSGSSGGGNPLPNGSMCAENGDCESQLCFVLGALGGVCGECLGDADCAATTNGGCSVPNPLATPPEGATCNMGEAGEGCESDAVCGEGLVCGLIVSLPTIVDLSTCGTCAEDADCGGETPHCSPTFDIAEIAGQKDCVAAGSVANGIGCDYMGTGNDACMSGHCIETDIGGLNIASLGLCNECATDDDCTGDDTCELPKIELDGVVVGGCMPPA